MPSHSLNSYPLSLGYCSSQLRQNIGGLPSGNRESETSAAKGRGIVLKKIKCYYLSVQEIYYHSISSPLQICFS